MKLLQRKKGRRFDVPCSLVALGSASLLNFLLVSSQSHSSPFPPSKRNPQYRLRQASPSTSYLVKTREFHREED